MIVNWRQDTWEPGETPLVPDITGRRPILPQTIGKMPMRPGGRVARPTRSAAAAPVAKYEVSPFGAVVGPDDDADGDWRDDAGAFATDNPFRFSTKWHDDAIGVSDFGARMYSATLGRFLNRDPIAEAGGVNLYAFVANNPVNYVDPFGYHVIPCPSPGSCGSDVGSQDPPPAGGVPLPGAGGDGDVGDNCADMLCPTGWPATYCPTTGRCECPEAGCADESDACPLGVLCTTMYPQDEIKHIPKIKPRDVRLAARSIPWRELLKKGGFLALLRCAGCLAALDIHIATCAAFAPTDEIWAACVCQQLNESTGTKWLCKSCAFMVGDPVQWARNYVGCR